MRAAALQNLHRLDRGGHVAGHPEFVAVEVERVGEPQLVDDPGQARDDLGRRGRAVAFHRLVEPRGVLAPFPRRDPARIDSLHPVRLGGPDQPGHDVAGALQLAGLDEIEKDLVVGHEQEAGLVEDGRVAQLLVGVLGAAGRGRRPRSPSCSPSRRTCSRSQRWWGSGRQTHAALRRVKEGPSLALPLGRHGAREIERGSGHVGVGVDTPREDDHAGRVDGAAALDLGRRSGLPRWRRP